MFEFDPLFLLLMDDRKFLLVMTDGITGTLERVGRATALELEASSCAIQVGEQHELPGASVTTNRI